MEYLEANCFLFSSSFLQCSLLTKRTIVFFEFLFDFAILWQIITSFVVTWTSISNKMAHTAFSRLLSLTLSGTQTKWDFFFARIVLSYHCKTSTLFFPKSHFARKHLLSFWSLFCGNINYWIRHLSNSSMIHTAAMNSPLSLNHKYLTNFHHNINAYQTRWSYDK